MAPRATAIKNETMKNPPQQASVKNSPTRGVKKKEKNETKKQKLKVKGWLETPADWAKFNAWANINAEPRKIPEPQPMARASKPLGQMKKRIEVLSKPQKKWDNASRKYLGVSKKALTAKPSKRIKILAKFVPKKMDDGREFPIKISRAALRYKASRRIIEISKPYEMPLSENCKSLIDITRDVSSRKIVTRKNRRALAKKAIECPDLLTEEELDILMTPTGICRSALTYKFTPWMEYLSLPSYRFLKNREDEDATNWKKYILEENEIRGKKALELKRRKAEKRMKQQEEKDAKKESKLDEKQEIEEENDKPEEVDEEMPNIEADEPAENEENEQFTESEEQPEEKDEEKSEEKDEEQSEEKNEVNEVVDETGEIGKEDSEKYEESSKISKKAKPVDSKKEDEDDDESARRKAARNAWRFSPLPYKDDPFAIKSSALKGKVSPRMAELAVPPIRKDRTSKRNPFAIRQSALTGPIPEGVSRLAKPNHPRDPIERPPPREKDSLGRPIYPMPPYGKKMPYVKPYEPAECPEKEKKDDDGDDDEAMKKKRKKRRIIDPIAYEATIDPCIDPERSKRQIKARKAAKEEMNRTKEVNEKIEEKIEEKSEDEENESPETENAVDE